MPREPSKYRQLRNAIDEAERVMTEMGIHDVVQILYGAPDRVKLNVTLGDYRKLDKVYMELNRLINDERFLP